jgi:hypothetical protein
VTFEEAVAAWLRINEPNTTGAYEIEVLGVKHEEAWTNESGTDWPSQTLIQYRVLKPNRKGKALWHQPKTAYVLSDNDPFEFVRELFNISERSTS